MTRAEIEAEATEYARLWGYLNTGVAPDWTVLVNKAYTEMVWNSECIRTTGTIPTVVGQAEYSLSTPDWKTLTDVAYDGQALTPVNEATIRADDANWLTRGNGTPRYWWWVGRNKIRLFPPPAAVADVTYYGTRAPSSLSSSSSVPDMAEYYHEGIALGAAYHHAKKYAKGESRKALQDTLSEYEKYMVELKAESNANDIRKGERFVADIEPDRVML